MIAAAVNCLVNDARRKLVFESMGCNVRKSVTPYARRNTGRPSRTTRTAAPGALPDFRDEKMASTCADETCPDARMTKRVNVRMASVVLKLAFTDSS